MTACSNDCLLIKIVLAYVLLKRSDLDSAK